MASVRYEKNISVDNIPEENVRRRIEQLLANPYAELIGIDRCEISGATTYNVYLQCDLNCYLLKIPADRPADMESRCIDIDFIAKFLSSKEVRETLLEMYGISVSQVN